MIIHPYNDDDQEGACQNFIYIYIYTHTVFLYIFWQLKVKLAGDKFVCVHFQQVLKWKCVAMQQIIGSRKDQLYDESLENNKSTMCVRLFLFGCRAKLMEL
jgi:hypothetical protein